MLDDIISSYKDYYYSFANLLLLHFTLTYVPRNILTTRTIRQIRNGKIGFNTILVGSNGKALKILRSFTGHKRSAGYKFIGFVSIYEKVSLELERFCTNMGSFKNIEKTIAENNIEEVIIAIESNEHKELEKIITQLQRCNVNIKTIPDLFEILIGRTELSLIEGIPLLHITTELMPVWEKNFKLLFDKTVAILFLTVFSPLYLFTAIGVKLSSKGPVFYKQKRVGLHGKEFSIYKFRSMINDAEKNGPELSSSTDPRITRFGNFMRKPGWMKFLNFTMFSEAICRL
ncbi:MAG: hypothetical protein HC831_06980 [Chloroflexia bacterium]|nr:hypothetical protein [Chloroflexia bacterium]